VINMSTRARWQSAGGGTSLIFLAAIGTWSHLASAEDRAATAAAMCQPAVFATGSAGSIIDGRTFTLDDGREVRLAGIEIPSADDLAAAGKQRLQMLVAGRDIVLKRLGADRDRYGRLRAQVFLASTGGESWVQAELVTSGHARVAAHVGDRACAAALIRHERAARAAKLGLWSDPYYALRRADDPAAVASERGRFTIVEGNVLSVRESGGTIYVNFGRRWSEDFTVTIAKRNERVFSAASVEPKALAGRRVRVRGWIEERGGPWLEATRPEQIELVERN
jgi:endonuclease YncB( thermonuclease family)